MNRSPSQVAVAALACLGVFAALNSATGAAPVAAPAATSLPALQWRLVGPYRGGWMTMAAGVPQEPDTYYAGAAGGGLWKSTDSGRTWNPISDGMPVTAVGALAVAPSDPRVVYVATGHPEPRYDVGAGSGVYRSGDAGRTFRPAGLAATRHIGAILVDRRDANVVLVAAVGHLFGGGPDRGVYRSEDGGQSWARTLFVDEATGAVDLAVDPLDPDLVYASTWTARVWPWLSYFTPVEGAGSALWRSRDGGRSWQPLAGEGWPDGALGRIGLAVTRKGAATRIYASVASDEHGGLYRSDDGGGHWQKVSDAGWVTNWYTSRLTVSPRDPDTLYTVGQSLHESNDGGMTFRIVRGAPGGDDFHYLWINPQDPARRIAVGDQGAIVSVNGGTTWSDWYNQPTGQFYHLATDNRFPYWIYSGQQDSGTVAITSRSDYGAIGLRDWHPVGGDERDYDLPDPEDASIVYASGLGGRISRWSAVTGEVANLSPWPVSSYGRRATDFRYHYNWFTPLAFSGQPPYVLFAGAQVLFRSRDRGSHWEVASPDLSGRHGDATDCAGNPDPARALACGYGVINTIAPAPRDNAEIWVGTDDGLVWLTRDEGRHWRRITPPGLPSWAKIASIDLLAATPGVAYLAVDNHRQDDFRPYVYRTRDYGASWAEIGAALPAQHYVSVVRADPERPGLLYAGTELGVQVSLDDGGHWQALNPALPPVWVHDLQVKGRDLIAATVGRAIWVLDDLAPLRQWSSSTAAPHLYAPSPAFRLRANQNKDTPPTPETPLGRNPPAGAVLDYLLARDAKTPVELEVRDAAGLLVRRYSSAPDPQAAAAEPYFTADWLAAPPTLPSQAGAHRVVWDLRYPRPRAIGYQYSIGASRASGTMLLPAGSLALPGEYQVTLLADGHREQVPLTVFADPRVRTPVAELREALEFSQRLAAQLEHGWQAWAEIGAVRAELAARRAAKVAPAAVIAALDALQAQLAPLVSGAGESAANIATAGGILADLATDVDGADRAPTAAQREVAAAATGRLEDALRRWQAIQHAALASANQALAAAHLPVLKVPAADQLRSAPAPDGDDRP